MFKKGKKQAKHSEEATAQETETSVSKDSSHAQKSGKTKSGELHKDKPAPPSIAKAQLPGKSLSEVAKGSQPTSEKPQNSELENAGIMESSETQKPENPHDEVKKPEDEHREVQKPEYQELQKPEVQKPGDADNEVTKRDEAVPAKPVLEDVITPQDEIAVEISPDVEVSIDKVN